LITVLEWPKEEERKSGAPHADQLRTYLSTSADCIRYDLGWVYAGLPIVDAGPPGSFDHGNVQTATEFLSYDGLHWLYYMGSPHSHETMNRPKGNRDSRIGLARFRLDGLAYLEHRDPAAGAGVITTKPFRLQGSRLHLNVGKSGGDHASWGVGVALVGANGSLIAESRATVNTDGLQVEVSWLEPAAVAHAMGSTVRLRFTLNVAALYAFQWSQ